MNAQSPQLAPNGSQPAELELVRCGQLDKVYRAGEIDVPVLHDVSFIIRKGEFVALMGASGSGKTTLMNILGCLDQPSGGRYWLDGQDVSMLSAMERAQLRCQKIGFVFQSFNLLPRTSALENVLMPVAYGLFRSGDSDNQKRAGGLLDRVGLAARRERTPSQLSGGEQQRVAIARALVNRPVLLLADEPTGNLDSRTSAEILRVFQELNAEGITIVLVTHDPEVARHARRVIRIRDGEIESDTVVEHPAATMTIPQTSLESMFPSEPSPPAARRWTIPQLAPSTVRIALHAIRRNAVRSSLTTLGIVIGIAAVIAMMEIGRGSEKAVQQTIASMGANTILVLPGAASTAGVTFGLGTMQTLTPEDALEVPRRCTGASAVSPIVIARAQIVYGKRNWVPVAIQGTTPNYTLIRDWEPLQEGVMFTDRDVRSGAQVCLVGQTIVRELFQGESPLGKEIRIQNATFKVVGVLRRLGANMMGVDQDDIVLAPWTTIKYRVAGVSAMTVNQSSSSSVNLNQINTLNQRYAGSQALYPAPSAMQAADTPQPVRFTTVDRILVKAASPAEVPRTVDEITEVLRERHRIRHGEDSDFSVRDMAEITRTLASTSELIGSLLLSVALISLAVGGVGIMNIMLVSVTERTRKIGLRMAVGASPSVILRQFLVEAIVLCLLGGVLGVGLGRATSYLVREILHWPTDISLSAIAAAVGVSLTVGLLFGFYPAWKASRLHPIEALRYE